MSDSPRHRITISVVSHGQAVLLKGLLEDIERLGVRNAEVLLTLNLPETLPFETKDFGFPLEIIRNAVPKGFGANHNAAFSLRQGEFFCVLNPDIRLFSNPFPQLLDCAEKLNAGVVAPLVTRSDGSFEDNARRFPTPFRILMKALGRARALDYNVSSEVVRPDWVAGMFMLFSTETFQQLGGFDERYFLYYEDVDICARLQMLGWPVLLCTAARVIHNAQRESHHSLQYFRRHLRSMMRFFCSRPFFALMWRGQL